MPEDRDSSPPESARARPPRWQVVGTVLRADGTPFGHLRLLIVRKRLRHEQVLAEGRTREDGSYRIEYEPPRDGASIDLLVRVMQDDRVAAESSIVYAAGPDETVDVYLGPAGGPSEFALVLEMVTPELDGVAIVDLQQNAEQQDILFLARSLEADPTALAEFVVAHKVAAKTLGIPAEAFYGLFRVGLPSQLAAALTPLDAIVIDEAFVTNTLNVLLALTIEALQAGIQAAIDRGVVSTTLADDLAAILAALGALRQKYVGTVPYVRGKTPVTDVLTAGGIATDVQTKFVAAFASAGGDPEAAFAQLKSDPAIDKATLATLRFTLSAGSLLSGNVPLVQHYASERVAGRIKSTLELAKLDAGAWTALFAQVDPQAASIPPVLPNETPQQRIARFSRTLQFRFEKRFPTPALLGRIQADAGAPLAARDDVIKVLQNAPSLELRDARLDSFLAQHPEALTGVSDANRPQAIADLKRMQRIVKLLPSYDAVQPLLKAKLDSARAIYARGEASFVAEFAPALGKTAATDVYRRASHSYARALTLLTRYNGAFHVARPRAIGPAPKLPSPDGSAGSAGAPNAPAGSNAPTGSNAATGGSSGGSGPAASASSAASDGGPAAVPDLQMLFGSQDYCQCEDCRSVLSPAAYMVDLMHFLGNRPLVPGSPLNGWALDILFNRRFDLWAVQFSCDNTNLTLPFIDLVCEVLEDAIVAGPYQAAKRQSSGSAADLRAAPAFVNSNAYDVLRGASPAPGETTLPDGSVAPPVYPPPMPFDLWVEQSRAYLNALGYARADVMRVFAKATPPAAGSPPGTPWTHSPDDNLVGTEALGLYDVDRRILVDQITSRQSWDYWGLKQAGNGIPDPLDPANRPPLDAWTDVLSRAALFMQYAQIDYDQLLQLLEVDFVNPRGSTGARPVNLADSPDPLGFVSCDTDHMVLDGISAASQAWLDRASAFLRLWRRTGIAMWDLDRILRALGASTTPLAATIFDPFSKVVALHGRLGVPYDELLSFWGPLDTHDVPDRIDGTDQPIPSAYTRTFLNRTFVDPTKSPSQSELDKFTPDPATGQLAAGLLIRDFTDAIAGALKCSADDLDAIRKDAGLTDSPAPQPMTVETLTRLFAYARLAGALGVTVTDLILWKSLVNVPKAFGAGATPATTDEFLRRYDLLSRNGRRAADVDYVLRGGSSDVSSLVVPPSVVTARTNELRTGLQKIADKTAVKGGSNADRAKTLLAMVPLVSDDIVTVVRIIELGGKPGDAAYLTSRLPFLSAADATTLEQPIAVPSDIATRYALLLGTLAPYVIDRANRTFVIQQISAQTGIEIHSAQAILEGLPVAPGGRSLIAVFTDPGLLADPIPAAELGDLSNAYARLSRVAAVLRDTKLQSPQVTWLLANFGTGKWLDPAGTPDPFEAVAQLLLAAQMQQDLRSGTIDLFTHLAQVVAGTVDPLTSAAALLGWDDLPSLGVLASGLGIADTTQLAHVRAVDRLRRAVNATLGLGMDVVSALGLANAQPLHPDAIDAAAVRQALKTKYDAPTAWNAAITPIEDALRIKKRDALVSYLMAKGPGGPWKTPDDLYAWFLIDTQMEPCQLTTRIKQGTASIQLFGQRCFLQLEPAVKIDTDKDPDWLQWKWMDRFRVWQAAREVFLWPENYLLPELRADASPFFAEVTKRLSHGNIDADTTESVFQQYLKDLAEVARLQVCAHYHQVETDGRDVIHVVARTRSTPPVYFYRQLRNQTVWTAWQKVEVGITGDHLLIIEWNRRLHLLWPVFAAKAKQVSDSSLTIPQATNSNAPGVTVGPPTGTRNQPVNPIPKNPGGPHPPPPGPKPPPPRSGDTAKEPSKFWEIQIAWSELFQGTWGAGRVATRKLIDPWYSDPKDLCFKASLDRDQLIVDMYRLYADQSVTAPFHVAEFQITDFTDDVMVFSRDGVNPADYKPEDKTTALQIENLDAARAKPNLVVPGWNKTPRMAPWYERFATTRPTLSGQPVYVNTGNRVADTLLLHTTTNAQLAVAQQDVQFDSLTPFFFEDNQSTKEQGASAAMGRSFFVQPSYFTPGSAPLATPPTLSSSPWTTDFAFAPFYHPFARTFLHELARDGTPKLLSRALQVNPDSIRQTGTFDFVATYGPPTYVVPLRAGGVAEFPREDVDFDSWGAYALYNWELFFHGPLLVALRLSANKQFEDAKAWFQYIFDPTDGQPQPFGVPPASDVSHYWQTKPFFQLADAESEDIKRLLELVSLNDPASVQQVEDWRADPFDPHAIASLRPVAYEKTTVMKYIDNLVAWGDQLFTQDTMETLAEATQLYVMAGDILGPRPQQTRPASPPASLDYVGIIGLGIDAFSNAILAAENVLPAAPTTPLAPGDPGQQQPPILRTEYFCVPPNPTLLAYWDTVADRLFKIRHCLDIEGKFQQLPLYEPPINPMLLVEAAAAGAEIAAVLNDEDAPPPFYRFSTMLAKAVEVCNEVKALGAGLLAALEKQDAETLATLRSGQEVALLTAMRDVKQAALDEANKNVDVLGATQAISQVKLDHYTTLKAAGLNDSERNALTQGAVALGILAGEATIYGLAAVMSLIPDFDLGAAGFGGTPTATADWGGDNLSSTTQYLAQAIDKAIAALGQGVQLSQTQASFMRRAEDWDLQIALAQHELVQITLQKQAANIRVALAQADLDAHDLQTQNAQAVDAFLNTKFTKAELYGFMVSQLTTVYGQAYQLAYALAKRANRAYNFELGTDETFITFGSYWDDLHQGLLAGELLSFDLRRMEASYCDRNQRELEITKHYSLALENPGALLDLRTKGSCIIDIHEIDYDDDYPGHYFRRLKSVSLTMPNVAGPYVGVNSTLTLSSSKTRKTVNPPSVDESVIPVDVGAIQAIATSSAQNDAGLFEVNFHDERYLPFEGQGAISSWQLELLPETNAFDLATVTDVILHIRYTARDGGPAQKQLALDKVRNQTRTGTLFSSMKQQFSDAFYRFLHPSGTDQTGVFDLSAAIFPFLARGRTITVDSVTFLLAFRGAATAAAYAPTTAAHLILHSGPVTTPPTTPGAADAFSVWQSTGPGTGVPLVKKTGLAYSSGAPPWTSWPWYVTALESEIQGTPLNVDVTDDAGVLHHRINPDLLDDIVLVIHYTAT